MVGAAALRDLVLMVREDQVLPARVNVDRIAQMLLDHGRAFDMPARPPASPGRLPAGKVVRRRLPKHEIRRVALERRSEEHTSELQSLMRISYAVFCLKKKITKQCRRHENNIPIILPAPHELQRRMALVT